MDRPDIEARIYEAARVIMTWPNPMAALQYRTSMPDIVRSKEDWLAYNSEASKDNLIVKFTPDSRQHQDAMEVLNWLSFATKRYKQPDKPTIRAILMLYCMNMHNRRAYGFRELSDQLKTMGVRLGREAIRQRYNQAMLDLEYGLARRGLISRYLKEKEDAV